MTLAERNMNPGNIKSDTRWKGCVGLDSRLHCIFRGIPPLSGAAFGVRALTRTLAQKMGPGQKPTLNLLIAGRASHGFNDGWAQESDTIGSIHGAPRNDPGQYALAVARWMGIEPDDPLDIFDGRGDVKHVMKLMRLIASMTRYEAGRNWLAIEDLLAGIELYIEDFVEKEKSA